MLEFRHEPAKIHNIGYFNKFLKNDDLEEHIFCRGSEVHSQFH